ncbi:asparaginase [Kiloniella laminariae]|uniref:asparaginase n=1 Tax=Kiloniella laminariae TaxID=454162 RepID=UPI00036C1EB6|nr:asparaginase [Kiloniella laminariae]
MPDQIKNNKITSNGEQSNPVMVEVTRGNMVESIHRAAYAVVDSDGKVVLSGGDYEKITYGRSAIKCLQALPLIETGAADAFNLTDAEISIACASHDGQPRHVDTVATWLKKIGCSADDLECGSHLPYHTASMIELLRSGGTESTLHNNCSGKHAGFLTVCKQMGVDSKGYVKYEHPLQQRILGAMESMCGLDLGNAPRGHDGCGIPVIGVPLANIALAMARFADPSDQPENRQEACARITKAIAAEPFMIAGSDRFCTKIIEATKGRALIKTGAEGVYTGIIPELGLGIALKADDGVTRSAETLIGMILKKLKVIDPLTAESLQSVLEPPIFNRAGLQVGQIRAAQNAPF